MGSDMAAWHWMHDSTHAAALNVVEDRNGDKLFFIDCRVTHHLINDLRLFSMSEPLCPPMRLNVANNSFLTATHVG